MRATRWIVQSCRYGLGEVRRDPLHSDLRPVVTLLVGAAGSVYFFFAALFSDSNRWRNVAFLGLTVAMVFGALALWFVDSKHPEERRGSRDRDGS